MSAELDCNQNQCQIGILNSRNEMSFVRGSLTRTGATCDEQGNTKKDKRILMEKKEKEHGKEDR
jgi:hypothetical protein